jgi:hypothetical protein
MPTVMRRGPYRFFSMLETGMNLAIFTLNVKIK